MKKVFLFLASVIILPLTSVYAQRSCGTMQNLERILQEDRKMQQTIDHIEHHTREVIENGMVNANRNVITIPVVVHVVYNTTSQNVSDAQIQSQLTVLNQDFRKLNADVTNTPSTFTSLVADCEINFCLATRDPNGNPTTGIIRKQTSVTSFAADDKVKYTSQGGSNAWPANQYLNIWVCNLSGGLLGYAQFPGGPAATDGVVINYTAFGTMGTAQAPFNKGRTATHEVGHWLNLRHIWGDATCGDDQVNDTPVHQTSNSGCPSHPKANSCGTSAEMFMNYMDYTDDACMYMFTAGQKARMRALFVSGGARASLATSPGCSGASTPQYCAAAGTNTQFEWIANVKLGAINNTSGANGGYGNFTSISTTLNKNTVYSITLTPGFASQAYTEYFRVYIDYNQDLDFDDAGELVYSSNGTSTAVSGTFSVPSVALIGNTRMRVMMKDAAITGPCETFTYGEVEDYTVNIQNVESTSCEAPSGLAVSAITTNSATLSWTAVSGASNYTVQVKPSNLTTWTSYTATSNSINITGLSSATNYNWQVRTNCSTSNSSFTSGSNFTTTSNSCSDTYETNNTFSSAKSIPVNTNINALISTNTDLDWFKFSNTSTQKNIQVTLTNLPADYDLRLYNSAGTLLFNSQNGGTTSETIKYNNAPVGTYYIRVHGYNGVFNTSQCYTLRASISSTAFKIENGEPAEDETLPVNQEMLSLYPNPSTDGVLNMLLNHTEEGEIMLIITDATGKNVMTGTYQKEGESLKQTLDVSHLSAGVYTLSVYNSNFRMTEKLVIWK